MLCFMSFQLTKKADQAEKDKNEAVIKYATREAEIMRVRSDMQKKEQVLSFFLFSWMFRLFPFHII